MHSLFVFRGLEFAWAWRWNSLKSTLLVFFFHFQVAELEARISKLQQEAQCQLHNAEATKQTLEMDTSWKCHTRNSLLSLIGFISSIFTNETYPVFYLQLSALTRQLTM